jgi:membrane protein
MNKILSFAASSMPADAYRIVSEQMTNIVEQSKGGLLTFGAIATLWSASSGVTSVMDGLNRAYDVEDERSFVKKRGLSLGITVGLALLTVLGATILVGSDKVSELLQSWTGIKALGVLGSIAGAVLGLGFMFTGLEIVYYYGPNVRDQKWSWITPGSLLGVVIFLAVSFAFSQYLRFSNSYNVTYGSIGGIIILMLWLYYLGIAILAGGEVNAIIALAALQHGNPEAPKYGSEEETDHPHKKSTAKADSPKIDASKNNNDMKPQPEPTPYYAFDDTRLSRQTQKRMASRRMARRERFAEHGTTPTTGWAILKRPISAIVYLGAIGYFLFAAITKHVHLRSDSHALIDDVDEREDALVDRAERRAQATRLPRATADETRATPVQMRTAAYSDRV